MSVKIIYSRLLQKFPEIIFGFSTKAGGVSDEPYGMNLSVSVGDDPENVKHNRKLFFDTLGIREEEVTFQKQTHSTIVNYSENPGHYSISDAIYTDKENNFLAVSVADCIPVFLYDPINKIVAGIHSGWKGTSGKILTKTILELQKRTGSDTTELIAYIGPGISQESYEVGDEVADFFDEDVKIKRGDKYFIDLKKDNYNQLLKLGVSKDNIEISEHCSFKETELLHSYRRDGSISGRMLGIIGMR